MVVDALEGCRRGSVLLDDFIEQTVEDGVPDGCDLQQDFWAAIFHHPRGRNHPAPNKRTIPQFFVPELIGRGMNLSLVIALSEDLAEFLQELMPNKTVISLKHPSTRSPDTTNFDPARLQDDKLRIAQIGTYMRNLRAIHQLPADPDWVRLRSALPEYYVKFDRFVMNLSQRWEYDGVTDMPPLTAQAYDDMLSRTIVFVEYYDASASNTVLECIDRNTPIVINRLPAHEEYLGFGYPGFYERFEQAVEILRDRDRLLAAHQYLVAMDKTPFRLGHFCDSVGANIFTHVGPLLV